MIRPLVVFLAVTVSAAVLPAAEPVDYGRQIKPILRKRCYACHGPLKTKQDLRLDTARRMKTGGDSGPAITPGKSAESLLIQRVTEADEEDRMPPEGKPLSAQQIELLRRWIDEGAKADVDEPAPDPREHWAFRVPLKVADVAAGKNPIDALLETEMRKRGLRPLGSAAPQVMLRRVHLDLVGLPPTREQLHAFLDDSSDDAYAKVVDQLLASPRHGERWGRHWMDVWRYSDWSGFKDQIRNSQRHIWRWRDWIIESLNDDKPYDRMIVEMLAGDELAPADPDVLRATGYLGRNWYKFNRHVWLDNTIEHTAKAFLGLTINCARCHDHKFDPISQKDYYRMRAFFEPHTTRTDRVPGQADVNKDGLPRVYDSDAKTPTYLFIRGNDKKPDKEHPLTAAMPAALGGKIDVREVILPVEAFYPDLRKFVVDEMIGKARGDLKKAEDALAKAKKNDAKLAGEKLKRAVALAEQKVKSARAGLASIEARVAAERAKYAKKPDPKAKDLALVASKAERQAAVENATLAVLQSEQKLAGLKAESKSKKDGKKHKAALDKAERELAAARKKLEAAQAAVKKPTEKYTSFGKQYPRTSTGRRLALARWIVNKNNPLTARVAVNHIWMRHFGRPLVDSVFDFGTRAGEPRHRALLDWLAVELMEHHWSMKHLHRLIVTSDAYRRTSADQDGSAANRKIDPDNHFLWRTSSRRLEAEAIRDSVLHVAGNLDFAMGGPEIDQKLGQSIRRRSVYFRHAYEKQMKFLELFDGASVNECYRRSESIVPQQALALANSRLSFEHSRLLARKLAGEAANKQGQSDVFITIAFEQVLSRKPNSQELRFCRDFLSAQAARLADKKNLTTFSGKATAGTKPSDDPKLRAKENLVHVLLNHNDFVTVR